MNKTVTSRLPVHSINADMCITCLATDRALFPLQETPQLVNICSRIALPVAGAICYECRGRLNNFVLFRSRALRARTLLEGQKPTMQCLSTLSETFISPKDTIYIHSNTAHVKQEFCEIELVKEEIRERSMSVEPLVCPFDEQYKSESDGGTDAVTDVKAEPEAALGTTADAVSGHGRRQKVQDPQIIDHFREIEVEHAAVVAELARARDTARYRRARYTCGACALAFSTEQQRRAHHRLHGEQAGRFACSICQLRFEDEEKLQVHSKAHYVRYSCLHCRRSCSSYSQMYYHYKGVHEETPRACKQCTATFMSHRDLKRHTHHAHPRKFACDLCGRLCATSDSLQRHRLLHDATSELECNICHKKYKGDFNLKNHIRSVHELKPSDAYCAECGLQFKTRGHYRRHLASGRHVSVDDYRFECDYCGRRFVQKPTLRTHIEQMHLRQSRYKCAVCQQSFHAAWVLSKHKRLKHSEKSKIQHICYVCQKSFRIYKSLKEHMNIHLGKRPFECKLCDATFAYSAALYNHNNLVHLKKKRTKKYTNT